MGALFAVGGYLFSKKMSVVEASGGYMYERSMTPQDAGWVLASVAIYMAKKTRIQLRLGVLSRIPSGAFFREVQPASEMGGKNGQNGLFCQNDQNDPNGLVF